MAAGALSSQACTTSTRFLSMGIGYTQIPTLARRHFVGWASPQSLVFMLTSLQLFELLPSPAWLSGRSVLLFYSTHALSIACTCRPLRLSSWLCIQLTSWVQACATVTERLRGWKAQEKASKESPKWRCWQSSNQTPLCRPRADSLGSSHQHSYRNMEWATHISPSSLKSPLICTPVSLKGGSTWLGSKFANLGWGMNWEWKAGTKLLKVKLDDRFTLPKHESHQRLS